MGGDLSFNPSRGLFDLAYYWGCARGFGRGTLYMKWGHEKEKMIKRRKRKNKK